MLHWPNKSSNPNDHCVSILSDTHHKSVSWIWAEDMPQINCYRLWYDNAMVKVWLGLGTVTMWICLKKDHDLNYTGYCKWMGQNSFTKQIPLKNVFTNDFLKLLWQNLLASNRVWASGCWITSIMMWVRWIKRARTTNKGGKKLLRHWQGYRLLHHR